MANKGVFCLEGLWETDLRQPSTIQPLLAFLKQNAGIPYIYRDCGTLDEFEYYLCKFPQAQYREYPILYLAFHGKPGKILLSGKQEYTISEIADLLERKCKGKMVLIGSCSVLDIDKRFLKGFLKKSGALAVLGYTNDVHWMRSAAFEMLILSEIQENAFSGNGIKAIVNKCNQLGKSFKHNDKHKSINFRMVSTVDL